MRGLWLYSLAWLGATVAVVFAAERIEPAASAARPWPFRPVVRPAVPKIDRVEHPIDRFIVAALEQRGLQLGAPAKPDTVLRRATFDLTGLPPSADDVTEWLGASHDYEALVDRLLASPAYGERMAQHWLDLVRYAESDGFNEDRARPGAYHYRDYVIRAFNSDLPYDRFLRQQLAGDELEPDNPDAQIATGFYRLSTEETNAVDLIARRQEIVDDAVDVVSQALFGLTFQCARCHDHKFDDISQADYYRLSAYFQPMLASSVVVAEAAVIERHRQQQQAWLAASQQARDEIDALLAPYRKQRIDEGREILGPEMCRVVDTPEPARTAAQRQLAHHAAIFLEWKTRETKLDLPGDDERRYQRLFDRLAEYDHLKPAELPRADTVVDALGEPPPTYRLAAGNPHQRLEEVQPELPAIFGSASPTIAPTADAAHSTGRRAALARWSTDPRNPVTARVMVNRVWQWHFGVGLVATANDFGNAGEPPSHRDLLDWLAADFVEHGWSVKRLHRQIMTSATYRQSSLLDRDSAAGLTSDPHNRYLWHGVRRRLEGEAVRDATLQIAGRLDRTMFGPSMQPELPPGVADAANSRINDQAALHRRSVYVFVKRNLRNPLFEAFDAPDRQQSCPRRGETTTPAQSLAMLNDFLVHDNARAWAARLYEQFGNDLDGLIRAAYREAYARAAADNEVATARRFIESAAQANDDRQHAVVDLCHALFNSAEFLYID
ncbi:MAG TPA: DUF1549 and DUF1553 domain-containing protein [Pirellulales bacterium]|nr:DUF1549 and DUF1553 domain-containing protein [Pirellulales bacterium]